jgi:hypothetical protein
MFVVTRTLIFPQQRRISLAPMPNGQEPPAPPPMIVTLELECDTVEGVDDAANIPDAVLQRITRAISGKIHFAEAARKIDNDLYITGVRVRSVSVTNNPLFVVKCEPNVRGPRITKVEEGKAS